MEKTSFFAKLSRNLSASRKYVIPHFSLISYITLRLYTFFILSNHLHSPIHIHTVTSRILKYVPSTICPVLFDNVDFSPTLLFHANNI